MEKFANYILQEKLYETRHSIVYRGQKEDEPKPVIIKVFKSKYPTPSEIARFRQEYELIKGLNLEGVIKTFDIINEDNKFALVLEDFDSVSIKSLLDKNKKFDLKLFLKISTKIAETLGNIHEKDVVHRDIKPHNILINQSTGEVKITDFGISTIITHENDEIYNSDFITGTLAYMSPEQTGRMNRTVDYRTDLYSLGITLYEMITGVLPFKSHEQDPMELIHSHIAVMPEPPATLDPCIPMVISDIIMRLLAKAPEERYQNGFGLLADIRECSRQLEEKQKIEAFELGKQDISNRFIIPQRLFGREKEINILLERFEDVTAKAKGAAVMVVSGVPGIGKSAMVNEIYKPIVARRGYFISGRYEQFRRDKPYSAIIQAFQMLVKQILSESEGMIGVWKQRLLNVLGENGKIITEVIPEVELIIGKQPDLPVLGPEESKNRFNFVFENFTSVFPAKEHPVALFLDDLQWADLASLQLLKNILTGSGLNYFFLILSFKDNEVGEFHPIMEFLRYIEKNKVRLDRIILDALTVGDLTELIKYFLRCPEEIGSTLAELVTEKTGGNPFFVNQLLHTLYNEKMIVHKGARGWQWDTDKISRMQVTDNLVDMMTGKIERLSTSVQEVLKICACIGNRFDLETLASVGKISVDKVLSDLTEAIDKGLVNRLGDNYVFHHDRIQEAAYSLITDAEKSGLHYEIGRLSLNSADETKLQKKLFYIVDQLNLGVNMIRDAKEKENLARLNLEAGKKAKTTAAYEPAFRYLDFGIDLLGDQPWENQYELTLALYSESVEAACLMGDFDKMNELAEKVIRNAKTTLDKINVYVCKIKACVTREDFQEAINVALPVLNLLGFRLPQKPTRLHVALELMKVKFMFLGKKTEDFLNLPRMNNPEKLAALKILRSIGHAVFYMSPNMLAINVLKAFGLMRHGLSKEHITAFAGYGIVLAAGLWDFKGSVEFCETALKMIDKLKARDQECMTILMYNGIVRHWSFPLRDTIDPLMEGYRIGMETGDLGFASFNLYLCDVHNLFTGMELSELDSIMAKNGKIIAGLNQKYTLTLHSLTRQAVLNLTGQCDDPLHVSGKTIDGEAQLMAWEKNNNLAALAIFWFVKLVLCALYDEYFLAIKASDNFNRYKDSMQGIIINLYAVLSDSICRLFLYNKVSLPVKIKYRVQVMINQLKMKKWADSSPTNCLHMYHGIEAVRSWIVRGNIKKAEEHFGLAINLCKKHNDIIIGGIINQYAAEFFKSTGNEKKANECKTAAYFCYSRWGATGLINKLTKMYQDLAEISDKASYSTSTSDTSLISTTTSIEVLDLATVMKISQELSSEIEIGRLLSSIMKLSIENAGAQQGFLIMEKEEDQKLYIEAIGRVNSTIEVLKSIPLEGNTLLSTAIVNYVKKTGENIVLSDAADDKRFINDPYIVTKNPKSILCAPIRHKGATAGIIYLENNLTAHAFTPERLKILQIFSAQAAIAIENAILYEKQKKSEESLKESFDNLNKVFTTTVNAMSLAIEARDPYTAGHQRRVADLASNIASELKLPPMIIDGIRIAGLIHDIGKISIPAEILTKPGKLTNIEFNLIKSHPQSGYDILNPIAFPWPVAHIVHQHHERINGSGYPLGLIGENILIESKIIAVADVVEAMASHRPYRASLGIDKALEEIRINSGKLYDRDVAEACFQIFKNGYKLVGDV